MPVSHRMTTYFTLIAAIIDGLNASPALITNNAFVQGILSFASDYLPFFQIGMGRTGCDRIFDRFAMVVVQKDPVSA